MRYRKLKWGLLIVGALGLIILAVNFSARQNQGICEQIEIDISAGDEEPFMTTADILDFISAEYGQLTGKRIKDIPLQELEDILSGYPFVARVQVYSDLANTVHIDVVQREPIIRVHPEGRKGYYIDKEGQRFSLSDNYSARVVVATGKISESMSNKLYTLAHHVNQLPFWKAQIEQIFVMDDSQIILIEKFGNHEIMIEDTEDPGEELEKLEKFYRYGLKLRGWGNFKTINTKYKGQIICK